MGEPIQGSFYEQELQKAKQERLKELKKVLRRDNKKKLSRASLNAFFFFFFLIASENNSGNFLCFDF